MPKYLYVNNGIGRREDQNTFTSVVSSKKKTSLPTILTYIWDYRIEDNISKKNNVYFLALFQSAPNFFV